MGANLTRHPIKQALRTTVIQRHQEHTALTCFRSYTWTTICVATLVDPATSLLQYRLSKQYNLHSATTQGVQFTAILCTFHEIQAIRHDVVVQPKCHLTTQINLLCCTAGSPPVCCSVDVLGQCPAAKLRPQQPNHRNRT